MYRRIGYICCGLLAFLAARGSVAAAEELKIDAGSGIAWKPNEQHYLATGRVRIIRGAATSWSDQARAYYGDDPETINRIELIGNVRFLQDVLEIEGDFATIYPDIEDVLVRGENLRLQNADAVVTAKEHLHYQGNKQLIYALGDALLVQGGNKIAAEKMKAVLVDNKTEGLILHRAFFTENVRGDDGNPDSQEKLYIEGERGLYDASEHWVRVCGDSRIYRSGDIMRGECAHYDLASENFQFLNEATLDSPLPVVVIPTQGNVETLAPKPKPTEKRTRLILKTNS